MRITQQLVANMTRQRNERAAASLYDVTSRVTATSAVERPSQDPVRATRINNLERFTHELDILDTSRRTIRSDLTAAESLVASMQDILVSAKDIALSMGSDNANSDNRANAGEEAQRLLDQLVGLANRRQPGGKYIFTGLAENAPPIKHDTAGVYEYMGDNMARLVEIGPGVSIEATITGKDIFGEDEHVLSALNGLISALKGNDVRGIRDSFNLLDDAHQTITLCRTEIGGRLSTIDDVDNLSADLRTTADLEHADLVAVDIAKLAPELSSAQSVLTAVVETTKSLMQQAASSWLR